MKQQKNKCPECGGSTLYKTVAQSAGGHGTLLPGLGRILRFAKFDIVVCGRCGLTRFYAEESAREKLPQARQWEAM